MGVTGALLQFGTDRRDSEVGDLGRNWQLPLSGQELSVPRQRNIGYRPSPSECAAGPRNRAFQAAHPACAGLSASLDLVQSANAHFERRLSGVNDIFRREMRQRAQRERDQSLGLTPLTIDRTRTPRILLTHTDRLVMLLIHDRCRAIRIHEAASRQCAHGPAQRGNWAGPQAGLVGN